MKTFCDYYRYATKMILKKGECIQDEGNIHAYFLHSGVCALCSKKETGEIKTHLYFTDQRIIGFAHFAKRILLHHHAVPSSMVFLAKTDCIVYSLSEEVFMNLMRGDPDFAQLVFNILSENYLNIFQRYLSIEEECVPIRICMFLIDYAYLDQGILKLPRFFTYNEIAEYLNIHPVTMSRVMIAMKQLGYVNREDHHIIIIDRKALENIVHKKLLFKY